MHGGFVEVSGNTKVSILSDIAELAEDIDVERAEAALEHHQHVLRDEKMENAIAEAICGRDRADRPPQRHRHRLHRLRRARPRLRRAFR